MATMGEIEKALDILETGGCEDVILLQCTTSYPTRTEDVHLRAMLTLHSTFGYPVCYSVHTTGTIIAANAVALGAVVIEKHFTLDQSMIGPDHAASLDPQQFREMVDNIRTTETALGDWRKQPTAIEIQNRATMRRSMVARGNLPAGTVLNESHFILKRPGDGLGAEFIPHFVGHRLKTSLAADQQFKLTDIE
jgi:sialic acid synthase SpsE